MILGKPVITAVARLLAASAYIFAVSVPALACAVGQFDLLGLCVPSSGASAESGLDALIQGIPSALQETAATALETWLISSRDASAHQAQPIPRAIRQALTGYIDDEIMDAVRFKVGDQGPFNLADLAVIYGDADAVTLVDVVVFRSSSQAYHDASLWAHELTHVKQFREWGVHGFALRYVKNPKDVEAPAYAVQNNLAAWAAAPHRTSWVEKRPQN